MPVKEICSASKLAWFMEKSGEEKDIAIASKVRLARNFRTFPFPNRADIKSLEEVLLVAAGVFPSVEMATGQAFYHLDISQLTELERKVLIEKQLIRRQFLKNPRHRLAYISRDLATNLLINEEDHCRIQCFQAGLDLASGLKRAFAIDDAIERKTDLAFDEKLGYLTSCPTNLGTGLRATVFVHLPGLVYTENMQNIITVSQQLGLSVRPLFGDGKEGTGSLYQISNQLTLGFSEEGIIDNLTRAAKSIAENERRARKALCLYSEDRLKNSARRALGVLMYASMLEWDETLEFFSKLRLGIDLGFIPEIEGATVNRLIIACQPSFLQYMNGNENMTLPELAKARAKMVQSILTGKEIVASA